MKKIKRYRIYLDSELDEDGNVERIYKVIQEHESGDWCKAKQVDSLESTIEELVEFLIGEAMSLSPPMRNYRGAAYYRVKDKLETLTGKPWDKLKKLQEEL